MFDRAYRNEKDYDQMRELLKTIYVRTGPPVYCTVGDLDWWRYTSSDSDVVRRVHLWFDDAGALVAFACPADDQVDLMVHPGYSEWNNRFVEWAEADHQANPARDSTKPFRVWSYAGDALRNRALEERGYTRAEDFFAFHSQGLDKEISAPELPSGYSIRNIDASDVPARVEVHRAAFAPSKMTEAKHHAVMRSLTYRAELDLVACAPGGGFGAYAIVWFDEANHAGIFEPVGCHPDHRRCGLATAVLREGMRRLQELGAHIAHVNSRGDMGPAAQLYARAGFSVTDRVYAWEQKNRPQA